MGIAQNSSHPVGSVYCLRLRSSCELYIMDMVKVLVSWPKSLSKLEGSNNVCCTLQILRYFITSSFASPLPIPFTWDSKFFKPKSFWAPVVSTQLAETSSILTLKNLRSSTSLLVTATLYLLTMYFHRSAEQPQLHFWSYMTVDPVSTFFGISIDSYIAHKEDVPHSWDLPRARVSNLRNHQPRNGELEAVTNGAREDCLDSPLYPKIHNS